MLSSIRLQNFKCIADSGKLDLAPITVFAGVNSSGKSSVIQALLLMKQTTEDRDPTAPLLINGPYVQLGSYANLIFRQNIETKLGIQVEFAEPTKPKPSRYRPRTSPLRVEVLLSYDAEHDLIILESSTVTFLREPKAVLALKKTNEGKYVADIQSRDKPVSLPALPFKFFGAIPILHDKSPEVIAIGYLYDAQWLVQSLMRDVVYLGPLREFPKRIYSASGRKPDDVGLRGELTGDVLWSWVKRNDESISRVRRIAADLGIAKDIEVKRVRRTNYYEVTVRDPNQRINVNLADSGFGVSQILPVIVAGYYAQPGSSIVLEQPEIHLHPRLQSRLADVFIELAAPKEEGSSPKQIIVETHSDYLIRRLCRRIAEGRIRPEQVAIFWFEPSESGTVITKVGLDEKGQIQSWPKGFMDEDYEEALEYAKALHGLPNRPSLR